MSFHFYHIDWQVQFSGKVSSESRLWSNQVLARQLSNLNTGDLGSATKTWFLVLSSPREVPLGQLGHVSVRVRHLWGALFKQSPSLVSDFSISWPTSEFGTGTVVGVTALSLVIQQQILREITFSSDITSTPWSRARAGWVSSTSQSYSASVLLFSQASDNQS